MQLTITAEEIIVRRDGEVQHYRRARFERQKQKVKSEIKWGDIETQLETFLWSKNKTTSAEIINFLRSRIEV